MYLFQFDGESLDKITYKFGNVKKITELKCIINGDKDDCAIYITIDSLCPRANLSIYFCDDYSYCFEY